MALVSRLPSAIRSMPGSHSIGGSVSASGHSSSMSLAGDFGLEHVEDRFDDLLVQVDIGTDVRLQGGIFEPRQIEVIADQGQQILAFADEPLELRLLPVIEFAQVAVDQQIWRRSPSPRSGSAIHG